MNWSILSSQRDIMSANISMMANFATSEGWNCTGPMFSHLTASPSAGAISLMCSTRPKSSTARSMRIVTPAMGRVSLWKL